MTLAIRIPESIYRTEGTIEKGTFRGRWHFSFGDYFDPKFVNFGTLRVFNDDTLSRGAVWPLHPHKEIEVVTYFIDGEFRHADERGIGGILQKDGFSTPRLAMVCGTRRSTIGKMCP